MCLEPLRTRGLGLVEIKGKGMMGVRVWLGLGGRGGRLSRFLDLAFTDELNKEGPLKTRMSSSLCGC